MNYSHIIILIVMEYNLYVNVDQLIFVSIIQQEVKMIQTL